MTTKQLQAAFSLATSHANLDDADLSVFDGFGLPDFKQVAVTVEQLARLIRWQTFCLNGKIDDEAMQEIARLGRHRFTILNA